MSYTARFFVDKRMEEIITIAQKGKTLANGSRYFLGGFGITLTLLLFRLI